MLKKINNKDKFLFIVDLLKAFIFHKKGKISEEVSNWEETIEIMNNPEYAKRIKKIEERIAHSV